jgi:stress-induced morphogen
LQSATTSRTTATAALVLPITAVAVRRTVPCVVQRESCVLVTRLLTTARMDQTASAADSSTSPPRGIVEEKIVQKLTENLTPVHLEVVNESFKHNVPKGSETHFKVFAVSSAFEGKKPIECHRLVNSILRDELANGVHALSIKAMVPAAFSEQSGIQSTPNCLGGSKK